MKQVLLINADIDKSAITQALIDAYRAGAAKAQAAFKEVVITDLKFNPNKQLPGNTFELEPDLADAVTKLKWANHIVVFCPVYKESINFRIKGFFDRIFMPDQVFVINQPKFSNDFSGKSARIISILDEAAWIDWQNTQRATYLSIKRSVLQKCRVQPVHTSTIGHLYSLDNEYASKWLKKLFSFGSKLI